MKVNFRSRSAYFLVLFVSGTAFLITLFTSDKYIVRLQNRDYGGEDYWLFYCDLDYDGVSEKLEYQIPPEIIL